MGWKEDLKLNKPIQNNQTRNTQDEHSKVAVKENKTPVKNDDQER